MKTFIRNEIVNGFAIGDAQIKREDNVNEVGSPVKNDAIDDSE
jgi:hypothetical protein